MPMVEWYNRVFGLSPESIRDLDEILGFFREAGVRDLRDELRHDEPEQHGALRSAVRLHAARLDRAELSSARRS
jgi:hypothetical protein